jgi:putative transposase
LSAISAITVSPCRQHLGLYLHVHPSNLTHVEVAVFLRDLLRHLRGHVVLIWDQGRFIMAPRSPTSVVAIRGCISCRCPPTRPSNPDEGVWNYAKRVLANGRPLSVDDLFRDVLRVTRAVRKRPALLRAFIVSSAFELARRGQDKLWPDDRKGRFKDNSDKPTGWSRAMIWRRARETARPFVRRATVPPVGPVWRSGLLHASCRTTATLERRGPSARRRAGRTRR